MIKTLFVNHRVEGDWARHTEFLAYDSASNGSHGTYKFKINIKIENGDCCGFNSNCCLSVMNSNGSFDAVTDNRQIGVPYSNNYYGSVEQKEEIIRKAVEGFKNFIEAVY